MEKLLINYKEDIKDGYIVQIEDLTTGKKVYYLSEDKGRKKVLYKYDNKGNIKQDLIMNNIYFDDGINIANNGRYIWSILGPKDEVYNKIFQS